MDSDCLRGEAISGFMETAIDESWQLWSLISNLLSPRGSAEMKIDWTEILSRYGMSHFSAF